MQYCKNNNKSFCIIKSKDKDYRLPDEKSSDGNYRYPYFDIFITREAANSSTVLEKTFVFIKCIIS